MLERLASVPQRLLPLLGAISRYSVPGIRDADAPYALIDFRKTHNPRTLRWLLSHLQVAGIQTYLYAPANLGNLRIVNELQWHPNTRLLWRYPEKSVPALRFTDDCTARNDPAGHIVCTHYDYSPDLTLGPSDYVMPLTMHTQIYGQYSEHERLDSYRAMPRKVRVLFAGNTNPGYENAFINEHYRKGSRFEIIQHLKARQLCRVIESADELDTLLMGEYWPGMAVIESGTLRIDQSKWMGLLTQADFILSPPGIIYPPSHNAVEGMAVGTIPFLNYPEWFFPNLRPLQNCVTFSTLDELEQRLRAIFQMSSKQIVDLRRGAVDYYTQHLESKQFVQRLLDSPYHTLHLHALSQTRESLEKTTQATAHRIGGTGGTQEA